MTFLDFQMLSDKHPNGMGALSDPCPVPMLNKNSGHYLKNVIKLLEKKSAPSRALLKNLLLSQGFSMSALWCQHGFYFLHLERAAYTLM